MSDIRNRHVESEFQLVIPNLLAGQCTRPEAFGTHFLCIGIYLVRPLEELPTVLVEVAVMV